MYELNLTFNDGEPLNLAWSTGFSRLVVSQHGHVVEQFEDAPSLKWGKNIVLPSDKRITVLLADHGNLEVWYNNQDLAYTPSKLLHRFEIQLKSPSKRDFSWLLIGVFLVIGLFIEQSVIVLPFLAALVIVLVFIFQKKRCWLTANRELVTIEVPKEGITTKYWKDLDTFQFSSDDTDVTLCWADGQLQKFWGNQMIQVYGFLQAVWPEKEKERPNNIQFKAKLSDMFSTQRCNITATQEGLLIDVSNYGYGFEVGETLVPWDSITAFCYDDGDTDTSPNLSLIFSGSKAHYFWQGDMQRLHGYLKGKIPMAEEASPTVRLG